MLVLAVDIGVDEGHPATGAEGAGHLQGLLVASGGHQADLGGLALVVLLQRPRGNAGIYAFAAQPGPLLKNRLGVRP